MTKEAGVNPYDFSNPITDRSLFAGREEQRREVEYYLGIGLVQKPIHLAVIGDRASGKTSFLNFIEREARQRDYLAARIDLNEDSVKTDLLFFLEVYEALLLAAAEAGLFGGLFGAVYQEYRTAVDTLEPSANREFSLFMFPRQYANAIRGRNLEAPVSQQMVRRDLQVIQREAQEQHFPRIALLFDECDVLAEREPLLQKIRNLLMHLEGYLLVFAGTGGMFPTVNRVFSPMARHFKRIAITAFDDLGDTIECIEQPLHLLKERPKISPQSMGEIHELTQGNPYEIRLMCHFMFRRQQEQRLDEMKLTVQILDDVLREMERLQDEKRIRLIRACRNLSAKDLGVLRDVGRFEDGRTLDEALMLKRFLAEESTVEEEMRGEWERAVGLFVEEGILAVGADSRVKFVGDEFDKLYVKYLAGTKQVRLYWEELPLETLLMRRLYTYLLRKLDSVDPIWVGARQMVSASVIKQGDFYRDVLKVVEGGLQRPPGLSDGAAASVGVYLFWMGWRFHGAGEVPLVRTDWTLPGDRRASLFFRPKDVTKAYSTLGEVTETVLTEVGPRTREQGIEWVGWDVLREPVVESEKVAESDLFGGAGEGRAWGIEAFLASEMVENHEAGDGVKAIRAAEIAARLNPGKAVFLNNLGYLLLCHGGDMGRCEEVLRKAIALREKPGTSEVNLGVVCAVRGDREEARRYFSLASEPQEGEDVAFLMLIPSHWPVARQDLRELRDVIPSGVARLSLAALALGEGRANDARDLIAHLRGGGIQGVLAEECEKLSSEVDQKDRG